ncbi:MAG: 23S rRNA (adenine(2503)-C(2))-methyltransferase RlmN [Phycisphaerae bacterium]|nr:23S rRNA (adenine(2503)-C(2))-methyltransferase RlmN [Phycisphaerae bacterium]
MTFEEIAGVAAAVGGKKPMARAIFSAVQLGDVAQIEEIADLSQKAKEALSQRGYFVSRVRVVDQQVDPDGTVKYLFEMEDEARVESVLMQLNGRTTVCLSCQVGCRMGCAFCATGRMGFGRHLTAGEMAGQVNRIAADCGPIDNVVYMGMGEPFDNYEEVLRSLRILHHYAGRNMAPRRLTVSTCGIPEGIIRLADEGLPVNLAVSLHSADDQRRGEIMASARRYSLAAIIAAVKAYQAKTRRRVMFEYCLLKGINDSAEDARAIVALLTDVNASVNLIEFNEFEGCGFQTAGRMQVQVFMDILEQAKITTTVRYKRGETIQAACGQLGLLGR